MLTQKASLNSNSMPSGSPSEDTFHLFQCASELNISGFDRRLLDTSETVQETSRREAPPLVCLKRGRVSASSKHK